MTGATLTLTGAELADARAVATWGVLDAASAFRSGDTDYPGMFLTLDRRSALMDGLGEYGPPIRDFDDHDAETLAAVAAELALLSRGALADSVFMAREALGDVDHCEWGAVQREHLATATRVIDSIAARS